MELRKRTGKSSKQVEAYIKELDSQITSKEKQSSDWTGRVEKARGEFRDWEQKRNGERAKFESEQARNKRILKEDGEKLNRELSENNEVRENIEETIGLKAELKKMSLDLPTFKSIVKETALKAGISPHIAKTIREAVKNLGSLDKAIAERQKEEKAKRQAILNLSGEERERRETLRGLDNRIAIRHLTGWEMREVMKLPSLDFPMDISITVPCQLDSYNTSPNRRHRELEGYFNPAETKLLLGDCSQRGEFSYIAC